MDGERFDKEFKDLLKGLCPGAESFIEETDFADLHDMEIKPVASETMREVLTLVINDEESTKLALTWFLFSAASVFGLAAYESLKTDFGTMRLGDEPVGGGAAKEEPSVLETFGVLTGNDMLRHTVAMLQASGFVSWLLDQKCSYDMDEPWYSLEWLGKKWNEYIPIYHKVKERAFGGDGE